MAGDLTPRQHAILAEIRRSIKERGYPPTISELADAVGLSSTSSVSHILGVLQEKGYIKRGDPKRPRMIQVLAGDETPPVELTVAVVDRLLEQVDLDWAKPYWSTDAGHRNVLASAQVWLESLRDHLEAQKARA